MTNAEKKLRNAVASFVYGVAGLEDLIQTYWVIFWEIESDENLSQMDSMIHLAINRIVQEAEIEISSRPVIPNVEISLRHTLRQLLTPSTLVVTTGTDTPVVLIDPTIVISPV